LVVSDLHPMSLHAIGLTRPVSRVIGSKA
jgi:hypothetical protein